MKKTIKKDIAKEIDSIKKKVIKIENDRDLKLGEIQKRVEARQIKKLVDSFK